MRLLTLFSHILGGTVVFAFYGGMIFMLVGGVIGAVLGLAVGVLLCVVQGEDIGIVFAGAWGGVMAGWVGAGGSGAFVMGLAGVYHAIVAEIYSKDIFVEALPECAQSAVEASCACAVAGALTGATIGFLWWGIHGTGRWVETAFTGTFLGTTAGFEFGLLFGAFAPHVVKTIKTWAREGWMALRNGKSPKEELL